ncbi:MAG: sulfite exporter TauE/SafE family protein, partial [Chloroflexi bacterium]
MSTELAVELVTIGLITGSLAGMLGAGGGFVTVPLLVAIGLNVHIAVSLSLAYYVWVAAAGVLRHLRQGTIDVPLGVILMVPGILAAQLGSQLSHRLPSKALELMVSLLLVAVLVFFSTVRAPAHETQTAAALPEGPGAERALGGRRSLRFARVRSVRGRVYHYTV